MHRSSETVGAIVPQPWPKPKANSATRKNPSVPPSARHFHARATGPSFRYASLASGLDIVRESLGQHEIATVQTTAIDQAQRSNPAYYAVGPCLRRTVKWDWPVCPVSETAAPHRMGAALTYAYRYALFALVGIAGEDDLDAPDLLVEHSPAIEAPVEPGIAEPAREKYRQTLPERIQRLRSTLNSPRRE